MQVRLLDNQLKARVSKQQPGAPQMAVTNGQGSFRPYAPSAPYTPYTNQQGPNAHVNLLADRIVTDSIRMGVASAGGQGALYRLVHGFGILTTWHS